MKKLLFLLLLSSAAYAQPAQDTNQLRTQISTWIVPNGNKQITAQQLNHLLNGITSLMTQYSVTGAYRVADTIFLTGPKLQTIKVVLNAGGAPSELDPTVPAVAKSLTPTDISRWNGKQNLLIPGTGIAIDAGTGVISGQNDNALWNASKMQGRNISSAAPAIGQVMRWNGTSWEPGSSTATGDDTTAWKRNGNVVNSDTFNIGAKNNRSLHFMVNNQRTASIDSLGARLLLYNGINPMFSMKQKFTNAEWQTRIGYGNGTASASWNLYNNTPYAGGGKVAINVDFNNNVSIGTNNPYSQSRLYVSGTSSGANIDAQGDGAIRDESNIECMSVDYDANGGMGAALRYFGSYNISGSTLGITNVGLSQLSLHGDNNLIAVKANKPLLFGIYDKELMRLNPLGKLGIGTTTPTERLSVVGNGLFTSTENESISIVPGSTGHISVSPGSDFGIVTNGQERVTVLDNGFVGFGTRPTEKIHAAGNILSEDAFILYNNLAGTLRAELYHFGTGAGLRTITAHPLTFSTTNTERMRISAGGNVGIGQTTPLYPLSIKSTGTQLHLTDVSGDEGAYFGVVSALQTSMWSNNVAFNGSNFLSKAAVASLLLQENGGFGFYSSTSQTPGTSFSGSQLFSVSATGNTTIGTGLSSRKLNVNGDAAITGSAGTAAAIMGRDVSGNISNLTLGAGFSITSGELNFSASGTGDASTNTSTSVDGEVAIFSGTSGKIIKRATGTGVAKITSGVLSAGNVNLTSEVSGTLPAGNGGTGNATYVIGDILQANATNTLQRLPAVATGNALISGGVGVVSSWGKIGLTTHVSGTLPVANGGTGATTLTGYVKGAGTSAFTASATIPGSDISGNISGNAANVTGTVVVSNGGTGATTLTGYVKGAGTSALTASSTIPGSDISGNISGNAANVTGLVAVGNGGTGATTLTGYVKGSGTTALTASSTIPGSDISGNISGNAANVTGTIAAGNGGTGNATYAVGDLLQANTTTGLQRLAAVATGSVLISGGVSTVSSWGKVGLTTHVSGTLPIANGGTGQSTASAALNAFLPTQSGQSGKVLQSDGTNANWVTPSAVPDSAIWKSSSATMQSSFQLAGNSKNLFLGYGGSPLDNASIQTNGLIQLFGGIQLGGTSLGDADGTLIGNAGYAILTGNVTANRTVTLPAAATGSILILHNENSNVSFSRLFGSTVKDAAGNTVTTIANDTVYILLYNATSTTWTIISKVS